MFVNRACAVLVSKMSRDTSRRSRKTLAAFRKVHVSRTEKENNRMEMLDDGWLPQ